MANFKLDYTGQKVNELLGKAAKSIDSSDIAGLASENYVDNAINNLDIPIVDSALDLESTNAIANKSVATALCPIEKYNVPMIDGQYGGIEWIDQSGIGLNGKRTKIRYVNDMFFVICNEGKLWQSNDGLSWTNSTIGSGNSFNDIAYGNGIYAVPYSNIMYTSTDAINWIANTATQSIKDMFFYKDKFVGVSDYAAYISTDAINWTKTSTTSDTIMSFKFVNNQFIKLGYHYIETSADGLSWITVSSFPSQLKYGFRGIAYDGTKYIAIADEGVYLSYDLATWTKIKINTTRVFNDIIYDGGQFVMVGGYATIFTSQNGTEWTSRHTESSSYNYLSIVSAKGLYIATSNQTIISRASNVFTAEGLALSIPITTYELNKVIKIKSPLTSTDTPLNINSLGAKTINGTIEQGKNYELVYNGSSWDIKTDNTIFKKQEIVFGETMFNNQKHFTCFMIGLLKNNSDLKIILPNSEYTLYTQEEGKEIKVITTDTAISVINNTDNTENIIYKIIE